MAIVKFDAKKFDELVAAKEKPVLVEYSAVWCVYCRRIAPALKKLDEQLADEIIIGQVDIDEEKELAEREKIELVPTFRLYSGGELRGEIVAPDSKAALEAFIRENLV